MKTIIRAVQTEPRASNARRLAEQTGGTVIWDITRNALDTFLTALGCAGTGPALHLEDDITLTAGFVGKVADVVAEHSSELVQFYSDRAADLTVGSRREPGRTFIMAQCFYLPAGMSAEVLGYAPRWGRRGERPADLDLMVADFLRDTDRSYWVHVPSLVQHQQWRSVVNPRRSSARTSRTFIP